MLVVVVVVLVIVIAVSTLRLFDYDSDYDNDNEGTRSRNFRSDAPGGHRSMVFAVFQLMTWHRPARGRARWPLSR
jgi:hypothetical protein